MAFCFVAGGNVFDTVVPGIAFNGDALDFFREVLNMDANEVLLKFQSWAVIKERREF